ncbi:MAG: hypothetical protein F6K31_30090 [Symploca sp. SIO2G7]|nr:hypothetical protein [Symploca sp. SIO2G7]
MKLLHLLCASPVLAVVAITTFVSSTPAAQQKYTFECTTINNNPVTVAKDNQSGGEPRQFIRWVSDFGSEVGYSRQQRCEEVTGRLNKYFGSDERYITHGVINNQNVICLTNQKGNGCNELLYTLKPDQDPKATIEDLFELNSRNFAGRPLREAPCPTYININDWLDGERVIAEEVCSAR